jgi:cytochrome c5
MPNHFKLLMATVALIATLPFQAFAQAAYLSQNWTDQDRQFFYFADQGSRLVPYELFLNLEQAKGETLFRDDANLLRLGLIPAAKSKRNPDALPIGVTRNKDAMGFTCAACHTQQLSYNNQMLRIDGGQPTFDLQQFVNELSLTIALTLEDAEKFTRLQQRMLGDGASEAAITALKATLIAQDKKRKAYRTQNHTETAYGYGRIDAFGAILNQALFATGAKNNRNEPNAPTSYPYIWDTPQHDYVEWNGSQSNSNVGAFARNIGEVIGVFGEIETDTTYWVGYFDGGYASSIQTETLREIEKTVGKLHSPLWPDTFPKIDGALAKQGRVLYEQHCIACHVDIDRTDPKRMIKVRMSTLGEIKTDPMMAENAILNMGKSGKLAGKPRFYFAGSLLPAEAPAIDVANNWMVGVIKNNPLQAFLAQQDAKDFGHPEDVHTPKYVDGALWPADRAVSKQALLAYKARPLNGIWTSAPFLHNGSVPNLYELLLPAAERSETFHMGSLVFDPKMVGFGIEEADDSFLFDTAQPGNSNAGHEYGTGAYGSAALTEAERWALVEYMKTL